MSDLLTKRFRFEKEEAQKIEAFLKPMLEYDIHKRVSASEALQHQWLNTE